MLLKSQLATLLVFTIGFVECASGDKAAIAGLILAKPANLKVKFSLSYLRIYLINLIKKYLLMLNVLDGPL